MVFMTNGLSWVVYTLKIGSRFYGDHREKTIISNSTKGGKNQEKFYQRTQGND